MEQIESQPITNFSGVSGPKLGIALGFSSPTSLHCGVLHKDDNEARFLHLAWHHFLRNDLDLESYSDYIFVCPTIETDRIPAMTALCRNIYNHKSNKAPLGIPYAVNYTDSKFKLSGTLRLGEADHGLTCATFVLAVFASGGFDLLKLEEWTSRSEDIEWHEFIVRELTKGMEKGYVSPEHVDKVKGEIGCSRFRPEQVAGGSTAQDLPSSFSYANDAGQFLVEILAKLKRLRN